MTMTDLKVSFDEVKKAIRDVPDFPHKGIVFKDITPVLQNPRLFRQIIDHLCDRYSTAKIDAVVAIESRGFFFGTAVAEKLELPFIPVRKKGKLPYYTVQASYDLEYGTDTVEMHKDALKEGQRAVIIDDLVATGGTIKAAAQLVEALGAEVVEMAFVIELAFLNPRDLLEGYRVYSMIQYS